VIVGSLCVIDTQPREFTEEDRQMLMWQFKQRTRTFDCCLLSSRKGAKAATENDSLHSVISSLHSPGLISILPAVIFSL
jgi:hypothetical protein